MKNDPVRVLHVFIGMNRSGVPVMLTNYHREIDKTKVQFDYAVETAERSYFDDEIEAMGGIIHRIGFSGKQIRFYLKLARIIRRGQYNIVHSHMNYINSMVMLVAFLFGVKNRISHSHNTYKGRNHFKRVIHSVARLFIRLFSTEYFACSSAAGEVLYGSKNMAKVKVIHNAINSGLFTYDPDMGCNTKKKLGIEGSFVIGHVGGFLPLKNHVFLIEIFHEIHKILKNSILVLVGDGRLKEKIEDMVHGMNITEKVLFLGARSDIAELLMAFDCMIIPSLSEGLSIALIEGQAAGLKCFASDKVAMESDISGLVEFIPLDSGAYNWATRAVEFLQSDFNRIPMGDVISANGYDIFEEVLKLQKIYIGKGQNGQRKHRKG